MIERNMVSQQNGAAVLHERRYHGLLCDDGFHLLAYCGKRIPQRSEPEKQSEHKKKTKKAAA